MFTSDFTAGELKGRRRTIALMIGKGAHLLIASAPPPPNEIAVQDANFYYLSGMETCNCFLLVEGGSGHSTLFMPSRETMSGDPEDRLGFEDAGLIKKRMMFDSVKSSAQLTAALSKAKVLYTLFAEVEGNGATIFQANGCAKRQEEFEWDKAEPRHKRLIRLLNERIPGIEVRDALPLFKQMRMIKSAAEIKIMRQAGQISAAVMIESMKATKPGLNENRLQAIAEYIFRDRGHCGSGYPIIAASGPRIWNGHYHLNNYTLKKGEVVLMDCGPDLRHYTSDIARVWPVSGVFGKWHRQVCGLILEYHKKLISLIRPGILPAAIYTEAARHMTELCSKPKSKFRGMKPLLDQMIKKDVRYLNHSVGLSVHDICAKWQDEPMKEGFVCVVDPMVWCEPQRQYIRVEDTVVVTAKGCERLTGAAPIELDEIERVMKQPSLFN
jgi:Xaa-Pro aminopeptidase